MADNKLLSVVICAIFISGCGGTKMVWKNTLLNNKDVREAMYIEQNDRELCRRVAYGIIPMPSSREFIPVAPSGYYFSGQIDGYPFSGTAHSSNGFYSSFASGYNMGLAIGEAIKNARREQIFSECMQKLGWVLVPEEPEGSSKPN